MAQFIVDNIEGSDNIDPFEVLVAGLIKENWCAMRELIMTTLSILKDDPARRGVYCVVLRGLPVALQYDMINSGDVPLALIDDIYPADKFHPLLREIFAMGRCSHCPNLQIRSRIANRARHFRQFLEDDASRGAVIPCPSGVPALNADAWFCVSEFMDVETLVFVLPLVCNAWRDLHIKVMACNTKVHDLYVQDLDHVSLFKMHSIAPWRHCLLKSREEALGYFGRCIVYGALDRANPARFLQQATGEYLKAVVDGKTPPPESRRGSASPYDSFLELFERAYEFCVDCRPALDRPRFLTDKEYEQLVHYFVYGKRWIMVLSRALVVENMPKLFSIINEDEELMRQLVHLRFSDFARPSIILLMQTRTSTVPERLLRLMFSCSNMFRRLVEPVFIKPSEYYTYIVESEILTDLMVGRYRVAWSYRLIVSVILSFKKFPDRIDQIVALVAHRSPTLGSPRLAEIKWWLRKRTSKLSRDNIEYPSAGVEFFKGVMARCGLWDEPGM